MQASDLSRVVIESTPQNWSPHAVNGCGRYTTVAYLNQRNIDKAVCSAEGFGARSIMDATYRGNFQANVWLRHFRTLGKWHAE
jgi:hypothetical protein